MCFYGLFALYLTSSAAAIAVLPVVNEGRADSWRGWGGKETVVKDERERGREGQRSGTPREKRKEFLLQKEIIVKGPHTGRKQARRQAD